MTIRRLSKNERDLIERVEEGKEYSPATKVRIDGEVLRNILVGLPLTRRVAGVPVQQVVCEKTGAGVRIRNAIIVGPVDLDSVVGCDGEPLCPLEFSACTLEGRFSAAHAHFSRLSFRDCTFIDRGAALDPATGAPLATVDLVGAKLQNTLDLTGIHADDEQAGLLWIRAAGIEVDGNIDLSRCRLRAPPRSAPPSNPDDTEDAIDLTLARIRGDLTLRNGSQMDGRFKMRNAWIRGDVWLTSAKIRRRFEKEAAIFMQGTRIGGLLVMDCVKDPEGRLDADRFICCGDVNLAGVEVGRSLQFYGAVEGGNVVGHDLVVKLDLVLGAEVEGRIDLRDVQIGGNLNLADLRAGQNAAGDLCETVLNLGHATIGRSLQLRRHGESGDEPVDCAGAAGAADPRGFRMRGWVILEGTSCDTLDDDIGRRWGRNVIIRMNHFTYRRTGWLSEERARPVVRRRSKPTYRIVSDWVQSRRADGLFPWRFLPRWLLARDEHFWEPWQLRRNWIYQHYPARQMRAAIADPFVSIVRHRIREDDFRPQPFEQAIRVARAEGREDFANQVEMHKQRLEWRFLNQRVRWALGIVAIILSALWLGVNSDTAGAIWLTAGAAAVTLLLMIYGSSIRRLVRKRVVTPLLSPRSRLESAHAAVAIVLLPLSFFLSGLIAGIVGALLVTYATIWAAIFGSSIAAGAAGPFASGRQALRAANMSSKRLTWIAYYVPALALLFVCGWYARPFHYIVAFLIFVTIRLMTVMAHAVMRFGFGYMRRPVYAVTTLIAVFLIGWWGVHHANKRNMFVVNAEPVAPVVGLEGHAAYPEDHAMSGPVVLPGSRVVASERDARRELSCAATISEPLFALDVLVPIVDLGEESRCEVRRITEYLEPERPGAHPRPRLNIVDPETLRPRALIASVPDLPLNDHRFWWWMKALYAIAGWFIVSLSILTFAQVNKVHAEPPHEHK